MPLSVFQDSYKWISLKKPKSTALGPGTTRNVGNFMHRFKRQTTSNGGRQVSCLR